MKNLLFIFLILMGLGTSVQSFLWDGTFQPFFNIRNQPNARIGDIYELKSGNLLVMGVFDFYQPEFIG